MNTTDYILIIIAGFLGALGAGYFGYVKSGAPFDWRFFLPSIWSSVVSAMVMALGYQKTSDLTIINFITAFLSGAGIDVLSNRSQGIIQNISLQKLLKGGNSDGANNATGKTTGS